MDEHPGSRTIPLTLNKYLYGNADPVNHVDPSGNMSLAGTMSGISGMAQMAAMSFIRMEIADMVSNALLSPIIQGVTPFIANANAPILGNAGVSSFLSGLALQCAISNKCYLKKVPVLVNGVQSFDVSMHILDSLMGNGDTIDGIPRPLPFILIKGPRRAVSTKLMNESWQCGGKRSLAFQCDEYPYAATFMGGNVLYLMGNVSLRIVSGADNSRHGNRLRRFYEGAGVKDGGIYINLALPILPTFYIDRKGHNHPL